jgi:hypothetical protein
MRISSLTNNLPKVPAGSEDEMNGAILTIPVFGIEPW